MTDIPNDVTTTATIALNDSVIGDLETVGDRDWYRFEATATGFVDVSLNGSGPDGINDTYLRIFDANGRQIAFDDDGGAEYSSALSFFAEEGETYFISAAAYESDPPSETGTYTLTTAAAAPPSPLDSITWGVQRDSNVITYFFAPDGVTRPGADGITSDGFNAYERAQFELAFDAISDVADISFVEVTSVEDADFVMILDDDEIINLPLNEQFSAFFVVASSTQAVGVFDANGQGWDGFAGGGLEVGAMGIRLSCMNCCMVLACRIRMTTAVVQIFWMVSGGHSGTMVNLT